MEKSFTESYRIEALVNRIDGSRNREKEFSKVENFCLRDAFVESETVIIEETMAALGECRSIDVTFESADIWTLRRREH